MVPFLVVDGGARAIAFYEEVFGAETVNRWDGPDGVVLQAQLRAGGMVFELSDPFPDMGLTAPDGDGPHSTLLTFWSADADGVYARAVRAGALGMGAPELGFSGDRLGRFVDPFGHRWVVATHVEDVSKEELDRRVAAFAPGAED